MSQSHLVHHIHACSGSGTNVWRHTHCTGYKGCLKRATFFIILNVVMRTLTSLFEGLRNLKLCPIKNSVALVRERTIPTERPPPVGEVSANFCGKRGVTWSAQRIPTAVNLCFLDRSRYFFFIQVAPQLTSRG